jgi:DNA modification methylase
MHTLINADCLEVLPSLPHFACCFLDPPDAIGLSHNGYKERPRDGYMDWLAQVLEATIPHCAVTVCAFQNHP